MNRPDITTEQWAVEYNKDRMDSAEDQIRIIDASPEQQNHPQGPLVVATLNARANAPHVEHTLAAATIMANAPQLLKALRGMMDVYAALVPGIPKIVCDIGMVNDNAIFAEKVLRDATAYDVNEFNLV